MTKGTAEIVICGAGIAGIAAAYHLAVRQGIPNIVLVDERPPMMLTSDKSTEAYRNWWPGPDAAMLRFMNRSIDLLEAIDAETNHRIHLNRRGYLYATGNPVYVRNFAESAKLAERMGAGPLRVHAGAPGEPDYIPGNATHWQGQPTGADLFLDPALIQKHFPYLTHETMAVLHARRCGWFSGQQLGMFMLEQAKAAGVRLVNGRVEQVDLSSGRVDGVRIATAAGGEHISAGAFVNAADPWPGTSARCLASNSRCSPNCTGRLPSKIQSGLFHAMRRWSSGKTNNACRGARTNAAALAESEETRHLLEPFPGGVHFRPEGGPGAETVLMLWAYHVDPVEPRFPIEQDPEFPETVLRGMATLVPGLATYLQRLPKAYVDGGYYTKTRENRPLIGPLPVDGA